MIHFTVGVSSTVSWDSGKSQLVGGVKAKP